MQQVIKNSVDQYTVLTVLPGETDQTSKMPVPQWCHFMESHADAPASCSTGSAGLSTAEGSSWLILMKTSFILMNCPFIMGETLFIEGHVQQTGMPYNQCHDNHVYQKESRDCKFTL